MNIKPLSAWSAKRDGSFLGRKNDIVNSLLLCGEFSIGRKELLEKLKAEGFDIDTERCKALPLPYLFLFGRYDQTVSIMGANIYPEDIERSIYAQPELTKGYASLMIEVANKPNGGVYPKLDIEWFSEDVPSLSLTDLAGRVAETLAEINSDFRNAQKEYPEALKIELNVHGRNQGPFVGKARGIKNRYIGASKH